MPVFVMKCLQIVYRKTTVFLKHKYFYDTTNKSILDCKFSCVCPSIVLEVNTRAICVSKESFRYIYRILIMYGSGMCWIKLVNNIKHCDRSEKHYPKGLKESYVV